MTFAMRVGLLLAVIPMGVWAIEPGPASRDQLDTEEWLQIQVSGKAQSSVPQVATPQEREQSLQRWLKTYEREIPEFYQKGEG